MLGILNKDTKKTALFIFAFCFLVRLIFIFALGQSIETSDGFDYHNHALSLLNGNGYPTHGSLPFMRPPLYPFLLSVVYYFVPHETYLTARIVNAVLDTLACYVFYKLILLIWNNKPTALLASLIYAVNPLLIFFSLRVRVEALFTLLIVTGVYLLIKEYKKGFPKLGIIILIGGIFGLACLCRSNATVIVMLIPLWMIFCNLKKWKRGILIGVLFALGSVLVISPWTIRNYQKYGEMITITDGVGYIFWISNTEMKLDDLNARNYQEYIAADQTVWDKTAVVERQLEGKSLKERDSYYLNLGLDYVKSNFPTWVWLNVMKFAEFWSPVARIDMQGLKALVTLPFGLLMFLGLFFYFKDFFSADFDKNIWLLFAILIACATLTGVMTWSSVRYRVPLVDPYVIPFGLFWLQRKYLKSSDQFSESLE